MNGLLIKQAIVLLTTKVLILLTAQSSLAFSFKYPSPERTRGYDWYDYLEYGPGGETVDRIVGYTWLTSVEELELGGSSELWELLNAFSDENPGKWEFIKAENDLEGSFQLEWYWACAQGKACRERGYNGVGSYLDLFFEPAGNDPVPDILPFANKLRWIQRVTSNHSWNDEHGIFENVLDEDYESQRRNPYFYDRPMRETNPGFPIPIPGIGSGVVPFHDTTYRVDPDKSHQWTAELYLAEIVSKEGEKKPSKFTMVLSGVG